MSTILTGLRANNDLHLGNYLGAILPMVKIQRILQDDDKFYMFVPDLHSLTTPIEHSKLFENSIENVRAFIAAGIDPNDSRTIIYRQSQIPAHSEMTWILSCFTHFGEASRMTEFREKSNFKLLNPIDLQETFSKIEEQVNKLISTSGGKSQEHSKMFGDLVSQFPSELSQLKQKYAMLIDKGFNVSVGLFNYPILMATDILLYDADYVPLGDDQKQHMELTRTIAERINNKFGNIFVVPKPWDEQLKFSGRDRSVRIMSLLHPEKKMSKSVDDPRGTILLTDSPEDAAKKIMSAQTDDKASINLDFESQPGISNLLQVGALLENKSVDEYAGEWAGKSQYGELKKSVAESVSRFLSDFQTKLSRVDLSEVESALERGEEKASAVANEKLLQVQKAVGLRK